MSTELIKKLTAELESSTETINKLILEIERLQAELAEALREVERLQAIVEHVVTYCPGVVQAAESNQK